MSNAEQVISTGIGAAVGFAIGGPVGAFTGAQYGLLAGSLLFPEPLPDGPRLEDFESLHTDPGAPIMVVYGTAAVPGFRLYLGPVAEVATTEEVGKGGPEQTTFSYYQTLALGLCEGVISGIAAIWENGELVYDVRPQREDESAAAYAARLAMSAEYEQTFVLYRGTESQLPDSTMELEQGIGNVPGFRGLAYMVYPDRALQDDQARRHPQFKILIVGRGELILTSRPYPLRVVEHLDFTGAPVSGKPLPVVFEYADFAGTALGGVLGIVLVEYENYAPEALDFSGEPLAGVLDQILLAYENYAPEAIDFSGEALAGTITTDVVSYENWEPEVIDFSGQVLAGDLDTP